ncbi:deuterosome assembly protein 1-like isoform X5 [Rhincodon typus]|uniref:deuterosome assembly protein 1-like isoform X5 n=1 Tax=Rhincodon typus TaxID=259920 RepID=UPI00202F6D7B|nr:deuterosome assembly protein 1-like isoform X5 [Rhincodon typus]
MELIATMEEIIKGLEKNSRLRDSSCEAELHELIHQIDVMVSCKNTEWEQHSQSLETQLEMRELELNNMQTCLEQKHHEVGKLRQQLEDFENFHREMILKYKERLKSFKSDLRKLQSSYEKLQKHQLKQAREPRKLEIIGENGETDSKQKMLNSNLEAQSSDAYWNCRKQIELCESEIKYLKSCMENAQDTIKSDETIIEQLKLTIEQKSTNEELNQKNQQKLSEEIKCYQRRCQKMESEITELQIELQSRDDLLQVTDIEQKQLRRELARAKGSLMRKDRDIRLMKQNSSNMMTGELTNFEMECQSSLKHLWASSKTETLLQTEILRLNAEQQNDELSRKEEELQRLQNEYVEANKEVNKVAKEQLGSLKAENQQLKKNLQTLEGRIPMIEGYQVKEMQNAYMASISELGYDNKRLQKDLVKLRAELEMSSKTSQEKYEAALRHTQQAVAEMKEHEDRRVKKLRQENEQQMNTMKIKLDETIHHYEGKIRNLQKGYSIQNNLRNSVPGFAGKKNREYSPERKPTSSKLLTANSTSYWHSSDITSVNIPDISPTCIHPEESFLAPNPTEMSDISSVTEHFLKEEEERARVLEKLLNSHVDELQTDSKCTVKMYAGAKVDMPATTALLCNCTFQEI